MLFPAMVTIGRSAREGRPEKRKVETSMDVVSTSREAMHGLRITKTTAKYKPSGITKKRCE